MGSKFHRWGRAAQNWQAISPNRVSLSIKEVSIMCSGCGSPHRGQGPSSVTQLPILTALHARSPTLFMLIIHDRAGKVNPYFHIFLLRVCVLSAFLFFGLEQINQKMEKTDGYLFILMKKLSKQREFPLLFVRYCFIIMLICSKMRRVCTWANS